MNSCRVDIWTIPLDEPRALLLSPDEEARANRLRFVSDRVRWSHAHSALREILGRHLNRPPLEITFDLGQHGKPAVAGLEFNLSHAGSWAMIAVSSC
ncbi:MAG: phosphopantetheine-protein transferase, partial [Acidobacteriota bacterium]